jgi:hypothetical protein
MSTQNNLKRAVRVAALTLALAVPAATVALAEDAAQAPAGGWYANINNPHPELPGFPKVARADNKIYANISQPHPEITEAGAGVFATTGSGAPLQGTVPQISATK